MITFNIDATGTIRVLHDEALNLDAWKNAVVERASEIEFDNIRRRWTVKLLLPGFDKTKILFSSPSRANCLTWEAQFVNAILQALN